MSRIVIHPSIKRTRAGLVRHNGTGQEGTAYYRKLVARARRDDCGICRRPRNIRPDRGGCICVETTVYAKDAAAVIAFNDAVRRGIAYIELRMQRGQVIGWVVFAGLIATFALAVANVDRIASWLGI